MGPRGVSVLAAFAAATAHGGTCAAIVGAASLCAEVADGVSVLRPIDVRASLGGPLSLLPLVELVDRSINAGCTHLSGVLSPIVHALTALLSGDRMYLIELERCDGLGMIGHLLGACKASMIDADLLAAICALDSTLEGHAALSDQLLRAVFLRLTFWAHGGFEIVQPLLRQLCRMAGERPAQWARTEALARLYDAMLEVAPYRLTSGAAAVVAASSEAGGPSSSSSSAAPSSTSSSPTAAWSNLELRAIWDGAFDVLCSLADTPLGVPYAQLRYIVHCTLRSGSRGVMASLIRALTARTYSLDLRLIEAFLDGGSASLALAVLSCMQSGDAVGDGGQAGMVHMEELRVVVLKFVGRVVELGTPAAANEGARLPMAQRWLAQTAWGKSGWAWLGLVLTGAPTQGPLLEAGIEVLLGNVREPHRRTSSVAAPATPERPSGGLDSHIAIADEAARPFENPSLLLPLLYLSSNAPLDLQRAFLLNLSLWLRQSHGEQNQAMLAEQAGWQLPICSMLNGTGDTDAATHDLCVQLLSEQMVASMRMPMEEGWPELQRSIAFIETHTVESIAIKRALFLNVIELLLGKLPLPSSERPQLAEAAYASWGVILRLLLLVEESFAPWDAHDMDVHGAGGGGGRSSHASGSIGSTLVRKMLQMGARVQTPSSSTRMSAAMGSNAASASASAGAQALGPPISADEDGRRRAGRVASRAARAARRRRRRSQSSQAAAVARLEAAPVAAAQRGAIVADGWRSGDGRTRVGRRRGDGRGDTKLDDQRPFLRRPST